MPFKPLSKHWLEAATVILAAGVRKGSLPGPAAVRAGTVSSPPGPGLFDYRVLMLQRSGKSGFAPSAKVFPGGVVDASDFSENWLDVFKTAGHVQADLEKLSRVHEGRSPMFTSPRDSAVPNEVGYRICAIRETFEESGVLLARPWRGSGRAGWPLPAAELVRWRKRVDGDAREFLQLCSEHRCVPDVWSLHEWSNWLTPVVPSRPNRRRYDTAFFICCLDQIPPAARDDREIVKAQWPTPAEVLHDFRLEKHVVAPPQVYELSRLCQLPSLADLHHFSRERGEKGCERWQTVVFPCEDGQVLALPGDDLYPARVDPEVNQGRPLSSSTVAQLPQSEVHRTEILRRSGSGSPRFQIRCNVPPKFGHLSPRQDVFQFVEQIQIALSTCALPSVSDACVIPPSRLMALSPLSLSAT
ncbi:Nucleoside diphosphate-linked moiety X motif 19, mitochondrial [Branchiostoma belcheri]|nr:Nucleoside diphosphate-linked moiety X motif 19, mitochondrial [Branchiostoma belcheri]